MKKRSKLKPNRWLRSTCLRAAIEELMTAQNQNLPTEASYARIVKVDTSLLCKIYKKHEKTIL